VRCLKTTGQIQNPQDFFEAEIAEVPPKNCLDSSLEFGARVRGSLLRREETGGRRRHCDFDELLSIEPFLLIETLSRAMDLKY